LTTTRVLKRSLSCIIKSIELEERASICDPPGRHRFALVRGGQAAAPGENASAGAAACCATLI
jgi:hypothetical protein